MAGLGRVRGQSICLRFCAGSRAAWGKAFAPSESDFAHVAIFTFLWYNANEAIRT